MDNVVDDLENLSSRAKNWKIKNKRSIARIDSLKHLDSLVASCHARVFENTDCLKCANCCRTTGPLFTNRDVDRLSKHLKIPAVKFIKAYLRTDEDGDLVLQSVPCPFLQVEDNRCSVYQFRPQACRAYPHTDSSQQAKIFQLTLKNAEICPAVLRILQQIAATLK